MKLVRIICVSLVVLSSFGQPAQNYQVGVIVGVKPHQPKADDASAVTRYEVSLKVAGTVYVVLYTPPFDVGTVKYAEGRNILVLVGAKTISYNDLLGQSFEVPILSSHPATDSAPPK